MTTIATDLRNTIESARRIRFEPTAVNSATDVQTAIVTASSGFQPLLPATTVVTATGVIPTASVNVQTNQSAPITLTLPDSAAWAAANGQFGQPLTIFDISGTASTNNVTINPAGADTISGLATLTIATDFGGFRLEPKPSGGWVVV